MKEDTKQHPVVVIVNNQTITTSWEVARYFGKEHKNVLQTIQNLECSEEFTRLNFQLSEYTDSTGRKLPMYNITRDGFSFLAMGFTGPKAARFKENYILAFNKMEDALKRIQSEALIEETKKKALAYFRRGVGLTQLLQDRHSLEKVEKFYWFRVHGKLTHAEAAHVCCLEPQHADAIATALRDIGLALPVISGQVRQKEISRCFAEASGGFLPFDLRTALADTSKKEEVQP